MTETHLSATHDSRSSHPSQRGARSSRLSRAARHAGYGAGADRCGTARAAPDAIGVCVEADAFPDVSPVGDNRLRPLLGALDAPPLPIALRRLIEWTRRIIIFAPPAAVLRMALASISALEGEKTVIEYRLQSGAIPERADAPACPSAEADWRAAGVGQGAGNDRRGFPDAVIRGLASSRVCSRLSGSRPISLSLIQMRSCRGCAQ